MGHMPQYPPHSYASVILYVSVFNVLGVGVWFIWWDGNDSYEERNFQSSLWGR